MNDPFVSLVIWGIFIGWVIYKICQWYEAYEDHQQVKKLRETNPQAYVRLKQMELEQQQMEHDRKVMQHQNAQTGVNIVTSIFRWLSK